MPSVNYCFLLTALDLYWSSVDEYLKAASRVKKEKIANYIMDLLDITQLLISLRSDNHVFIRWRRWLRTCSLVLWHALSGRNVFWTCVVVSYVMIPSPLLLLKTALGFAIFQSRQTTFILCTMQKSLHSFIV